MQPDTGINGRMDMENVSFTWRQRFILFAIYFCVLVRGVVPGIALVLPVAGLWKHFPGIVWFAFFVGLCMIATGLTERFSGGVFRYAIRRL